mmetsp:Transcript_2218/g.4212  ORF Transcript_2218/g.4212 Transcript_2218/m.4212 type:complete len:204 (-) Transcript_2218:228-839(-)|eukprot:CAMPEP_0184510332 /NCGR_PEP_ID=MMETSP0198_2-20121128/1756_1 /TAXON_ID=1112570 /ORGANISM="Thraustochytrium sp., Strain LLF1b" /LENGTH=203 /DNA_ID=CAMNT_0026900213 /DNA_START=69 /DNA_END=680 /DNA_ORIENTATION=-
MDDFDDLLFDDNFDCNSRQETKGKRRGDSDVHKQRLDITSKIASSKELGVDDLLRELELGEDEPRGFASTNAKTSRKVIENENRWSSEEKDEPLVCNTAVLGGEAARLGRRGSAAMKVASETVRCVKCDFAVERWTGMQWKDDTDYMFFRNNMPDRRKVATKLFPQKGKASYACQCTWLSVEDVISVRLGEKVNGTQVNWIAA